MAPSRAAFSARLRALSPAAATDFLADLYAAQGWSVQQQDGRLTVRRDGHAKTVVLGGVAADAEDADVVVTRGPASPVGVPDDADRLDADDLYERVRYAVDAAASDRLLSTYFEDLPVTTEPARPRTATDDATSVSDEATEDEPEEDSADLAPWSRRALLVAAGAVLGGGATAVTTALDRPGPVSAPGVTADGVTDPAALAEAHAAAADARSFTMELDDVRRNARLELRSALALHLSLAADRSYLAEVSTAGPEAPLVLGRPPATSVYWSDGERYYVDHRPDAWTGVSSFRPLRGWVGTWRYWSHIFAFGGRIDSAPEDYFRALFAAVPLRLVERQETGDERRYRLAGRALRPATPPEELAGSDHRAVELSAVVDGSGMVRSHDVRYRARFDGDEGRVRRSIAYTGVGETRVHRPAWTLPVAPDLSITRSMADE